MLSAHSHLRPKHRATTINKTEIKEGERENFFFFEKWLTTLSLTLASLRLPSLSASLPSLHPKAKLHTRGSTRARKRLHAPLRYLKTETPAASAEVQYVKASGLFGGGGGGEEEGEEGEEVCMCVKGGGGERGVSGSGGGGGLGWGWRGRLGPPPPCQTVML